MRRVFLVTMATALMIWTTGCGSDNGSETTSKPIENNADGGSEDSAPGGEKSDQATQPGYEDVGKKRIEELEKNDPRMAKEANTTSVMTYIKTTREFGKTHDFFSHSTLAKTIHNQQVTLLAPTNDAWDNQTAMILKGWVRDGQIDKLDKYLRKYVLDQPRPASKIGQVEGLVTMGGVQLVFNEADSKLNGFDYDKTDIFTNNGQVVKISGLFALD